MLHILMAFCAMLFVQTATAGIMVEPFFGLENGTKKCTDLSGADCTEKSSGMEYGLRAGYAMFPGLWAALEYNGNSGGKWKPSDGSASSDIKTSSLGLTVGFDSFIGLRFFAGMGFMNNATLSQAGQSDTKLKGGTNNKVGIGYKLPMIPVALNLEYRMRDAKEFENSGTTIQVSDAFSTFSYNTMVFTVSAPLSF